MNDSLLFWRARFKLLFFSKLLSTDSSYRFFFSPREPPTVTELGQPVYVEVFVVKHEDEDLMLLLEDCWATPTKNPNDPHRWNLLVKGWIHMKLTETFDHFYIQQLIYSFWKLMLTPFPYFDQPKLISVSNPDVLSVVIATELLCCQLSPVRSWSIPLFISGLWWSSSHLWSPKHLKTWYVRFFYELLEFVFRLFL